MSKRQRYTILVNEAGNLPRWLERRADPAGTTSRTYTVELTPGERDRALRSWSVVAVVPVVRLC